MLPTKILKLRLSRIQKGKQYLSTQDQLMLVTSENPDLSANFLLRLFKLTLPKQWQFHHENDEDILYATQLIQLIEDEFIAAYSTHARKYGWYEQCLMYQLNFVVPQPTQQQINSYLRQLEQCLDQPPKIELLHYFQHYSPCALHANALAKAYAGAGQYTQAMTYFEWAAQHATQFNEVAFYAYIECLLKRNQPEYQPQVSDIEYAIDLLVRYQKPIDQKAYRNILQQAVSRLLPKDILQSRATKTRMMADAGRSLNALGKTLNSLWGGREHHLPFSREVIASAPQLLTEQSMVEGLAQAKSMQHALQQCFEKQAHHPFINDSSLLQSLWQALQHDPAILELLVQPAQYDQLMEWLQQRTSQRKDSTRSENIQLILQQGLMAYLGEVRLDKQHPERDALYAQYDRVVTEMTAFAEWFYRQILLPYLEQQTQLLQQVHRLAMQLDETALSSGLFALQFEMQQRVQDLANWMQYKLEMGHTFEHVQVAWVALRELPNFEQPLAHQKVQRIELALEQYKVIRLSQIQRLQPVDTVVPIDQDPD
ncbi:hypothetical protein ACNQO6_10015 [Acinetobacter calcoaceticus]|uniref:hypothetical protein n=1 Tax=Acinetobacter calcoaceticus TaxID=471 RepID=UPI002B2ECBF3|nr:hypothetical protein SB581_01435 [Acinetobacter baumannii]